MENYNGIAISKNDKEFVVAFVSIQNCKLVLFWSSSLGAGLIFHIFAITNTLFQ